jgi:hypothetical protein
MTLNASVGFLIYCAACSQFRQQLKRCMATCVGKVFRRATAAEVQV